MHPREIPSHILSAERRLLLRGYALGVMQLTPLESHLESHLELIESELARRPIQPHELEIAK